MTAINGVFKTVFSLLSVSAMNTSVPVRDTQQWFIQPQTKSFEQDTEQAFLASIAHLGLEEKQKQIQRHQWYVHLAQQQGISEAEHEAEALLRTDL
jgi:hypothetical protein